MWFYGSNIRYVWEGGGGIKGMKRMDMIDMMKEKGEKGCLVFKWICFYPYPFCFFKCMVEW